MHIFEIANLANIDLLILGVTNTAITILGFVVFLRNQKSITNQTFFLFALIASLYTTLNFFSYQTSNPGTALWLLRFVIFLATLYSYLLFQLFYTFPKQKIKFSKFYKYILIPIVLLVAILTLTPFVFTGIKELTEHGVPVAKLAPGAAAFGLASAYLVIGGLVILFRKTIKAAGIERKQFEFVLAGALITYLFIIVFNLILPLAFDNTALIPLAPLFTLPFIIFTTYAILRFQLLNIKVIATETLTAILAIVTLFEVLFSNDVKVLIFRVGIFIFVLLFGVLLIRSVRKEVRQREQLQKLSQELAIANQELKRLDKAKSEFVSIASHQLRTPLTAIKGYLSLVLDGTYGTIEQKFVKPIQRVYDSNERLIRMVNDLLSLSRIESGKIKYNPEPVQITEVVESLIEELSIKIEQNKLELNLLKPAHPIPAIIADKEKVRNILLNIIDNSIRYTRQGSITISIESVGKIMHITVQDTGEGMNQEEIKGLFQSFSRGQAGKKLSTEGAGLGLYIARKFVEMHNGKIWAESAGKGKGSAFHFELPVRQQ